MLKRSTSPLPLSIHQRLRIWWQSQSHPYQDILTNLIPLGAACMFFIAAILAFIYLQGEEHDLLQNQLQRDKSYTNQRIALRLREINSKILTVLLTSKSNGVDSLATEQEVRNLFARFPETLSLTWLSSSAKIQQYRGAQVLGSAPSPSPGATITNPKTHAALKAASNIAYPVYSAPSMHLNRPDTFELVYPLASTKNTIHRNNGALILELNLDALIDYAIPNEFSQRYAIASFITQEGAEHFRSGSTLPERTPWLGIFPHINSSAKLQWTIPALGNGLQLRFQTYRRDADFVGRSLFWIASGLTLLTMCMLFVNWRHMRKRNAAQDALLAEANFRRAIGDSMLTGVRVLDTQAQVTFVNPAFCHMTGFSEEELINTRPPFPYWPSKNIQDLQEILAIELQNTENTGGPQVQLMRKNGSFFYARVYTSPLIGARDEQVGWVTSITDITEPTRIRQQLTESFDRFTTVLESLDASISVVLPGNFELVFANKLYRDWFGTSESGHHRLLSAAGLTDQASLQEASQSSPTPAQPKTSDPAASEPEGENAEVHIPELKRWLEVRSRYLTWVDGHLAQMIIASDITPRRQTEALELEQAQRAEKISRLVTMGEMASGMAHELNQPLTAINNYCTGMLQRIQNDRLNKTDLHTALEKTVCQTQRAGQIIHRIREFVKRSEPKRVPAQASVLVSNTLELAEIELRKRGVRLCYEADPDLPTLMVDSILIEQVLINLLKNAAESIEQAHCPMQERIVQLQVRSRVVQEAAQQHAAVEFCVQDTGKGIAPETMEHLYDTFFSTKDDGMGMGLSLCRSIVESHQGRIQAKNLYNGASIKGCQFSFWLPVSSTKAITHDASTL